MLEDPVSHLFGQQLICVVEACWSPCPQVEDPVFLRLKVALLAVGPLHGVQQGDHQAGHRHLPVPWWCWLKCLLRPQNTFCFPMGSRTLRKSAKVVIIS